MWQFFSISFVNFSSKWPGTINKFILIFQHFSSKKIEWQRFFYVSYWPLSSLCVRRCCPTLVFSSLKSIENKWVKQELLTLPRYLTFYVLYCLITMLDNKVDAHLSLYRSTDYSYANLCSITSRFEFYL